MIRLARSFLILLAVVALGLAGMLRGPAMASTQGLTEMVLCGGSEAQTVWLDATGTPVHPEQDCEKCPACIAGALNGLPPSQALATPAVASRRRASRPAMLRRSNQRNLRPVARGPPLRPPGERKAATAPFLKAVA